jgi:hypothetical protein
MKYHPLHPPAHMPFHLKMIWPLIYLQLRALGRRLKAAAHPMDRVTWGVTHFGRVVLIRIRRSIAHNSATSARALDAFANYADAERGEAFATLPFIPAKGVDQALQLPLAVCGQTEGLASAHGRNPPHPHVIPAFAGMSGSVAALPHNRQPSATIFPFPAKDPRLRSSPTLHLARAA